MADEPYGGGLLGSIANGINSLRPTDEAAAAHAAHQRELIPGDTLLQQLGTLALSRLSAVVGAPGDLHNLLTGPPLWKPPVPMQPPQQPMESWRGVETLKSAPPSQTELMQAFDRYVAPGFLPKTYLDSLIPTRDWRRYQQPNGQFNNQGNGQ